MSTLSIDVYADIACPWCYVGRARLKQALAQRPALDVSLQWRPFQLQPDLPPEGSDFRAVLEAKFGDWHRAQQMFDRLRTLGEALGIPFDFDAIDTAPNTAEAHRLVLWAEDQDRGDALATALFRAYFSEGRNVSDRSVLTDCATTVGLDANETRALLDGDAYDDAVRMSQREAQQQGVTGVPCYVFDDNNVLVGAQPVERFVEALESASATSH